MILNLPKTEQLIVKRLRALILECLPMAREKEYHGEGAPFYSHHRMICYLWPGSLVWGPDAKQKNKGVTLGFSQGYRMSNEDGVLLAEGRKQVYVMYFHSLNEINEDQVRALLFEASMIDDAFGEKKKRSKKK